MASIRFRNGKWQARVIRVGFASKTKTFATKQSAEKWARSIETDFDLGISVSHAMEGSTTFKAVIERYIRDVLPEKRGGATEAIRLSAICRSTLAQAKMVALTPIMLAAYRDQRLTEVSPGTVVRELAYLSSIINVARREWGFNIQNPISNIRKPSAPEGRTRLLSEDERTRLFSALIPLKNRNPWVRPAVILSLETAMRLGEILALRWENISLEERTAYLSMTKNGSSRLVPLSSAALDLLNNLPHSPDGKVFPINAPALCKVFERACKRAGIEGFRWHDLRHVAITELAKKLNNVIELAAVSGHKSLTMLKRYYHPAAAMLALKLG